MVDDGRIGHLVSPRARPTRPAPSSSTRLRRASSPPLSPSPLGAWLDSWAGIGRVAVGMHRQGYDFQLTQYDERVGARRSTRPAWSTARRARRAPRGSARRGYCSCLTQSCLEEEGPIGLVEPGASSDLNQPLSRERVIAIESPWGHHRQASLKRLATD